MPIRVVYLIGAGATQAEIDHRGGEKINLLMQDNELFGEGLATRIIRKAHKYRDLHKTAGPEALKTDVEKLISLLDNTGLPTHRGAAEELRQLYRAEIMGGLQSTGVLDEPDLAIHLLKMHQSKDFAATKEQLVGIIDLNHDWLFQVASKRVYGGINLCFPFASQDFTFQPNAPPIVKPHGSFNWKDSRPVEVTSIKTRTSGDILWIPPTILKESKDYPYNKLIGTAHEMLATNCDVLRVIGCRLSQNDWNIVSLLFTAQYRQSLKRKSSFRVELIMPHRDGELVKKEYSYLQNVLSIGYLRDGDFSLYLDAAPTGSELQNPFRYWLKTKIRDHVNKKELQFDATLPDWLR